MELFPDKKITRVVVFRDGTVIIAKTPISEGISSRRLDEYLKEYDKVNARFVLNSDLKKEITTAEPKDDKDREEFNKKVCKKFGVALFYIPKGERKIDTLYYPEMREN